MKINKVASKFTYLLPALIIFFGQFNLAYHFLSTYAYVDGCYVNYYEFVVHIVDLCFLGSLLWYVFYIKLWKNKNWIILSTFSFFLWIVHNLIFLDPIVFYWSARLFLYFLSAFSIHYSLSSLGKKQKAITGRYIVLGLAVSSIFQSVVVLLQFFRNRTVGLHFLGESFVQSGISGTSAVVLSAGTFLRGYGTFPHPNIVGGFLSVCLIFYLSYLLFQKEKTRLWILIPLLTTAAGLIVTWSRSAWIFFSVGFLILLYLFFRKQRSSFARKGLGVLLVIFGALLIWFAVGNDQISVGLRKRIIRQSANYDESVIQRRQLNQKAVQMYEDNILTGVGAGKFIERISASPVYTGDGLRIVQPVHNVFLLAAAELGFMALWIFSYFLYHSIKGLRRSCYLFFPLLFLLTVGNLDHYPITLPQGLLILIILDWLVVLGESIGS